MEVITCPICPPQSCWCCGPDLGSLRLFNYNNHTVFMHELLDEYTSMYTQSKTPFRAWMAGMERQYNHHRSRKSFMTDRVFCNVWFTYICLQPWTVPNIFPVCGPSPSTMIWDGI
ncbi:hypothetical protein JB92DRAFT_2648644, partial [Gautieria morchelliformis]